MCFEESFSPFTRDALNFRPPKINAVPHRSFHSPPDVITAPCDAPFNILLYECAFCSFNAHAHRKS